MKRTCNGCRAYEPDMAYSHTTYKCSLGYFQINGVPKEQCPKPRTIKAFCSLLLQQSANETEKYRMANARWRTVVEKCVLCQMLIEEIESPFLCGGVYVLNPETFRKAWMHGGCLACALEVAREQKAKSFGYASRYDEYIAKLNEH